MPPHNTPIDTVYVSYEAFLDMLESTTLVQCITPTLATRGQSRRHMAGDKQATAAGGSQHGDVAAEEEGEYGYS